MDSTLLLLILGVLFVLFVLPRLRNSMGGQTSPRQYPPQTTETDYGSERPRYDTDEVETRGGFGRDRGSNNSGGIFGNIFPSRPTPQRPTSGGSTGIFRSPTSSRRSPTAGNLGSSSPRQDSPDVESRGGFGRDRD